MTPHESTSTCDGADDLKLSTTSLWILPKHSVKSEKYCSYGHLAGTLLVQKTVNVGTLKSWFLLYLFQRMLNVHIS
jgi:hypothetical protein